MSNLIIRHLSGSKSNQKEIFSLEKFQTITLGRDTSSNITYDPVRDDLVSRQHAQIEQIPNTPSQFKLTDLNSSNGVYVNKDRVHESVKVTHGDRIQLGKNGPEFTLEIDPPPPDNIKKTRIVEIPPKEMPKTREASALHSTTMGNTTNIKKRENNAFGSTDSNRKPSIGPETEERMILNISQKNRTFFLNIAAGILGIIALVAALFIYNDARIKQETKAQIVETHQKIADVVAREEQTATKVDTIDELKSPREIADQYSAATVYIEVSWKIIDTGSGKQLYHKYITKNRKRLPAYLRLPDGTVEPWLINDDENGTNGVIGSSHTGTGFVVSENGFIITNRHVAATWLTRCSTPTPPLQLPGKLYYVNSNGKITNEDNPEIFYDYKGGLDKWVPAKTRTLGGQSVGLKRIEGRLDTLDVTFPKNKLRIPAKLVRISNEHDVALLKIDTPQAITKVTLHNNYDQVRPGDPITIMGYPAISPDVTVATKSKDPFNPSPDEVTVPDPTITPGVIGRVIRGVAKPVGGEVYNYYSGMDSYQLTATATGAGNSGGPVFDEHGGVIGIFYASREKDTRITFAVPIRFAIDLMEVSPVL